MKLFTKYIYTIGLLCATAGAALAQQQSTNNSVEVSPFVGIGTFAGAGNDLSGGFYGAEAVYHLNMANNPAMWVKQMHVIDISFAASFRQMGDVYLSKQPSTTKGIIGQSYGITSRLAIKLAQVGGTKLLFTPGFGFAYATETFYTNNNPLIGSHINFTAQAGLKVMTPLWQGTRLQAGVDLYHYSNAAFKLPNDGVNTLNASIGIDHDIDAVGPQGSKNLFVQEKKNTFELAFNVGRRGLVQTGGGLNYAPLAAQQRAATSNLWNIGLYGGYNRRINHVFGLKAGIDAVYYVKPFNLDDFYGTYQELASSYDNWRVGASTGFDIFMGRVVFNFNVGKYIHFASYQGSYGFTPDPPTWYWDFGGKYFINQTIAIEAKQYLHRTEADYVGLGLLFRLNH